METEEDGSTYVLTLVYKDERDSEHIEQLSKKVAKNLAHEIKIQVEAKKEFATIEVDENGFYIFRMIDIKDVQSIEVDEE